MTVFSARDPARPSDSTGGATDHEAPAGPLEVALAEIWSDVLEVERVGRQDDFVDLGGDSLGAAQVISRIRQVFGVEVPVDVLYDRVGLADFAEGVREAGCAEAPPVLPVDREGGIPLSFQQQGLWVLEQVGSLGSAYHIARSVRLRGPLDRSRLVGVLDWILARHEALRTTFPVRHWRPEQRIQPAEEARFLLLEHDLTDHPEPDLELQCLAAEEAAALFDLERGPLARGRLIRTGEEDHTLLVTLHHMVSDGWSMRVLVDELNALYSAPTNDGDPLPELPIQYADYAGWQRGRADAVEGEATYWADVLEGAPELLELPVDHPRPAAQDYAGDAVPVVLDEALTAALKEVGPTPRHDAVHDPPGGVGCRLEPSLGPGRRGGGHAHRQPRPDRDRGADRLLHQHPRRSRGLLRSPHGGRAARDGEATRP